MKTKLLALALVSLFAVNGAMAQEQGDMRAGIGVVIGTKAGVDADGSKAGFGLSPSFEYVFADAISGAVSYDWYFKSTVGGTDINIASFNIDGRYYFVTGDTQVYGLAGIGIIRNEIGPLSDSETGLNIGAGATFGLSDSMGINGQIKYQTPGDGQLVIGAGVVFMF
ncbi:MAG: outer membrane beta-barrel protein [Reichenbachiella sp.]|uniref:outer membrane beta-barrel protein n=1 Tax=Reichenbachiella sp. TaxID=2184521 RepID=UPI00326460A8